MCKMVPGAIGFHFFFNMPYLKINEQSIVHKYNEPSSQVLIISIMLSEIGHTQKINHMVSFIFAWAFQVALVVKNPPANAGDPSHGVRSLGLEDPLKKEMAIHSSILAWKIPWTEEAGGLQSEGLQNVRHY